MSKETKGDRRWERYDERKLEHWAELGRLGADIKKLKKEGNTEGIKELERLVGKKILARVEEVKREIGRLEKEGKPTEKALAELNKLIAPEQIAELQKRRFERTVIAVEGNLLEIPIADYSRGRIEKKKNYVVYENKKAGIKTVIGSMHGALTGFDEKVLKGGICNFTQRIDDKYIANFSLYEMAKHLGLPIGGRLMERLRLSLRRIGNLRIEHTGFLLWNGKDKKEYQAIAGYSVFEPFIIAEKDAKQRINWFVWGDLFSKNYGRYFKNLDRKVYLTLDTPISSRCYDYLEKKFGKSDDYQEGEKSFMEKIPIKSKNYSYAKGILIKNLGKVRNIWKEEKGVTLKYKIKNGVVFFKRSRKKIREDYKEEGERIRAEREERGAEQQRRNTAYAKLVDLKVDIGMVMNLFKKYDLEIIENQLEWLPYRRATKNKAGLIVGAIKENWIMPGRYEAEGEEKLKEKRIKEYKDKKDKSTHIKEVLFEKRRF